MKTLLNSLVAFALLVTGAATAQSADSVTIDSDTYAAVAFSKSTGKYGYGWNYGSKSRAEAVALSECKADDAEIVGWVKYGWLVLVVGDDNSHGIAWEYGDGANSGVARNRALTNCFKHTKKVTKIITICSGNVKPKTLEFPGGIREDQIKK